MNQPTMTNEQFALWITLQTRSTFSLPEADKILAWLEAKDPKNETLTMTVPVSEEVYQLAKSLDKQKPYTTKKK